MLNRFAKAAIFVAGLNLLPGQASATLSASIVNDFSTASNPNGVWSYEGAGVLLASPGTNCAGPTTICWTNGQAYPSALSIIKNTGPATVTSGTLVIPTDYLNLDTQSVVNASVVFTAPSAGIYNIIGAFRGDDTYQNSHNVQVFDDSSVIYSAIINTYGQVDSFNLAALLRPGDTIGFVSNTGATLYNLSTGLQATITSTQVSEPASMAVFGLGIMGLTGFRVGRSRK